MSYLSGIGRFRQPCRYSYVCPKGANYQWGKDPLE
jgi:hypothetical protein